jgi:type IV pilus assembly protein PilQ
MATHKTQATDFVNKPILQDPSELRTKRLRHFTYILLIIGIAILLLAWPPAAIAQTKPTLDAIDFALLAGNRVRIELRLSEPVEKPLRFATHNPARIVLDFPGVSLNLKQKTRTINIGLTHSVTAVEARNRTRVVIQLFRHTPYKMDFTNGTIFIIIGGAGNIGDLGYLGASEMGHIEDIIFEHGNAGDGRIHVKLSDPSIVIDTHEKGDNIIVVFFNTELPKNLNRILDVTDFATPILTIDTFAQGNDTRMIIKTTGNYEHLVYQTHKQGSIELKPIQ